MDHRSTEIYPPLWIQYVDGNGSRALGHEYGLSGKQIYSRVTDEMHHLPDNTWVSHQHCNRWSGILNLDGKHIAVKNYKNRQPFLWGVDFLRHDFPVGILTHAENIEAFTRYFRLLKTIHYPLRVVISDDVEALRIALPTYFPRAKVQLCHVHYIENIRQKLKIRSDDTYHHFFNSLMLHAFADPMSHPERHKGILHVLNNRTNGDPLLQNIIVDIAKKYDLLFAYQDIPDCPKTNNIIESFNSHLKGRLKTIKGFQSFDSASRFLNAYLIRRRIRPYTDCEGRFKQFNGKIPLELSIQKTANWPSILGSNDPRKTEQKP